MFRDHTDLIVGHLVKQAQHTGHVRLARGYLSIEACSLGAGRTLWLLQGKPTTLDKVRRAVRRRGRGIVLP
jgi:hypothetical protein